MAAVNFNFDIEKGSDFSISFVYIDNNGNPIDLSDKCVILSLSGSDGSIRRYSSRALADYSVNGWELIANNLGAITWNASASETGSFNFTNAVYDLDVKEIGTIKLNNIRISEGLINILNRNIPLIDSSCPSSLDALESTPPPPTSTNPDDPAVTPTPTVTDITDFCLPYDCGPLDLFSTVYNGSGLVLDDLSTTSDSVNVTNTGLITNVELAINKLSHNSPTDLVMLLSPPSGDKILLAANHKIFNFNNNFSFMFSNKADNNIYLHNVSNGQVCNIYDKTEIVNYNNENLLSSFDHLFGASLTGVWSLIIKDTDPLGSGSIDSWKLIITYNNTISEDV
jgi:subtilisin-like proprotein convertase family protein